MPDFLIRDLDEATMSKLKVRANLEGRSLQAEIKETLRASVKMTTDEFLKLSDRWVAETEGRDIPDIIVAMRRHRDAFSL